MDLANYSRSLSQMVTHEIYRDCSTACDSGNTGVTDQACVKNCSAKHAQFLSTFDRVIHQEIPKLQELSRIQ
jgi:hypothetical protein